MKASPTAIGSALGIIVLGGVLSAVWIRSASAATVTVTGTVVDLFCYDPVSKVNAGMDHQRNGAAGESGRECAIACAKWEGQPVGLVAEDGTLYQLDGGLVANNNAKIVPHMTHKVTIRGTAEERHGVMMLTAGDVQMAAAPAK